MSRTLNVFAWILLGAMAAGLGTGFFLFQANHERAALAAEADLAKQQAADLAQKSQQLADEANAKLATASDEIKRAQDLVKQYDSERQKIERALILTASSKTNAWKQLIDIPLGISIKIPPAAKEQSFDPVFTSVANQNGSFTDPEPWIIIEPYSSEREQALLANATSTQEALFFSAGKLFDGVKGQFGSHTGYLLHVQSAASSTHLIWMQTAPGIREADLLDVIAGIQFRT